MFSMSQTMFQYLPVLLQSHIDWKPKVERPEMELGLATLLLNYSSAIYQHGNEDDYVR